MNFSMNFKKVTTSILFFAFLIAGVLTLPHYGTNWDTVNHLPRGQAYLNYFLSGKRDFSNLPKWHQYWQNPDSLRIDADTSDVPRRSFYESDATTFNWFMDHDGNGHPPLSDILSAGFNKIFFSKLRIINDIDSYRVYGIVLAAALVALIFWWVSSVYSPLAGLVSALSLCLYPLFWAESHFNTEKDIPETVFWSFMLFSIWQAVKTKKIKWNLAAGIFFGLALGTKFNIIFSVFIIVPWLAFVFLKNKISFSRPQIFLLLSFLLIPSLGYLIFVAAWPYLWADPIGRTLGVAKFYKSIGTTTSFDPRFQGPFGINLYPLIWIITTTPLVTLALVAIGVLGIIFQKKTHNRLFTALVLLWLITPIARVTWRGAHVYGGVRQVMEYVPALSIVSGIGAYTIIKYFHKYKSQARFVILALFVPVLLTFINIHPNENVYFNELIGGLAGAKNKNIPSWGNTFGSAYRQGVSYINKNAKQRANVVLAYELLPNIPKIFFRPDINFHNSKRSGYLRQGEWAITLVYQGTEGRSHYDTYLEKYIKPSFQAQVDGVAILKVWENSEKNLIKPWKEEKVTGFTTKKTDTGMTITLLEKQTLARVEIDYDENSCPEMKSGTVRISNDHSKWMQMPGILPNSWRISSMGVQPYAGKFIEPFNGEEAKHIDFVLTPADTCLTNFKQIRVFKIVE